jgi:hypothetical protein
MKNMKIDVVPTCGWAHMSAVRDGSNIKKKYELPCTVVYQALIELYKETPHDTYLTKEQNG